MLPKIIQPEFTTTRPSTGQRITFRPWTVKEEKVLLVAKESGEDADILSAIKQVVRACVVTPGFDVESLPGFDVEWLFIQVRMKAVAETCTVNYVDPGDGISRPFEVDLKKVVVEKPADEKVRVVRVNDSISFTLKFIQASTWTDARVIGNQDFEILAAKSIDKIFEGENIYSVADCPEEEVIEFVQSLPARAAQEVTDFWKDTPHLSYSIKYINSQDQEREVELTSLTDFFSFA